MTLCDIKCIFNKSGIYFRQMERAELKQVEIRSAGRASELLNVPDTTVVQEINSQMGKIGRIVFEWISKRPKLDSGHSSGAPFLWERDREFLLLIPPEAIEFLTAVRENRPALEIQLELGDMLVPLLISGGSDCLLGGGSLDNVGAYLSLPFQKLIPDLIHKFNALTAEEILVLAADLVNRQAGSADGSKLVDINQILTNANYKKFDKLLNYHPIINSEDLMFDLVIRYALLMKWDISEIINRTIKKNDETMPAEFFGSFAPFESISDILACLRLFRKYTFTTEEKSFKKQFSEKISRMESMWPTHPLGYEFRLWINSLIDDINKNKKISPMDRALAAQLQKRILIGESPLWGSKNEFKVTSI